MSSIHFFWMSGFFLTLQSPLGLSRIIGGLDPKINDVIAAISNNDDRQNRFKAAFSNILEFN